jgi:hypothetical protein
MATARTWAIIHLVFYRAAALVVVGSMAGCFAQGLDAENKTCSPDALCPSAYTCVLAADAGGLCQLTPCAPSQIGLPCDAGLGPCSAMGVTFCNTAPGGVVDQSQLVQCNADAGTPHPETCNGIDDDCDGIIDNHLIDAPPCELQLGVCANSKRACINAHYEAACVAADYGLNYEPLESRCDGLDNDCDGRVDVSRSVPIVPAAGDFTWASSFVDAYTLLYVPSGGSDGGAELYLQQLDADFNAAGSVTVIPDPGASRPRSPRLTPQNVGLGAAWLDESGGTDRLVAAPLPSGAITVVATGTIGSFGPPKMQPASPLSVQTVLLVWSEQGQLFGAVLDAGLQLENGPASLQYDAGPSSQVASYDVGLAYGCSGACQSSPPLLGQLACGSGGPPCALNFSRVDGGALFGEASISVNAIDVNVRVSGTGDALWSAWQGASGATLTFASGLSSSVTTRTFAVDSSALPPVDLLSVNIGGIEIGGTVLPLAAWVDSDQSSQPRLEVANLARVSGSAAPPAVSVAGGLLFRAPTLAPSPSSGLAAIAYQDPDSGTVFAARFCIPDAG